MTYFEWLIIAHMVGDWILQPHYMAIRKTSEWPMRTLHVAIYTTCFWWTGWQACLWLFVSHWLIDTYKPLYWFRRLRRDFGNFQEFVDSFKTPDGFFVNIAFDQIFHVLCFVPVVLWSKP